MSQRTVTIGETTFDHVSYDRDADVLYLSVGEPQPADQTFASPEGHAVRFDQDRHVIGVTLVSPNALLKRGSLQLTLPQVVRVDRAELEVALRR
jgi:uncharacterized protein YuzE